MPRKTPSTKLFLWDEIHVSLHGPSGIRNNIVARRNVEKWMNSFRHVIRECMKDRPRHASGKDGIVNTALQNSPRMPTPFRTLAPRFRPGSCPCERRNGPCSRYRKCSASP